MDWRTTLLTLKIDAHTGGTAEDRFRDAFERLKLGEPRLLPKGTPVSQNNVAKEAGCDPSALRKTRFPTLVFAIQEWVESQKGVQPISKRQRSIINRAKNRDLRKTISDLKKQRDVAVALLADSDLRIIELSERLAQAHAKLAELEPKAVVLDLSR